MGLFGITVPEEYGGLGPRPGLVRPGLRGDRPRLDGHRRHPRQPLAGLPDDRHARHRGAEAAATCPTWPPASAAPASALTEPDAGTDLQGIRTTARRDGDDVRRQRHARCGSPTPATPTRCRCWSRPTRPPTPAHRGMSVLLVEADTPGYEVTRDIAEARLQGHRVLRGPARRRPGARRRSCSAASRAAACSRCSRRWSGAGSTSPPARWASPSAAYDEALAYAEQRKAFGQPIARVPGRSSSSSADLATTGAGGAADGLLGRRRRTPAGRADVRDRHGQDLLLRGRARGRASTR